LVRSRGRVEESAGEDGDVEERKVKGVGGVSEGEIGGETGKEWGGDRGGRVGRSARVVRGSGCWSVGTPSGE
jgi:hypothetical protein